MKALSLSFYHPSIIPGGAQQVAYNLHSGLLKAKHDSYFIGFHNNLSSSYISDATPIVKIPLKNNEYICNVGAFNYETFCNSDPWSFKAIVDFIEGLNPDVIYVHHFLLIGVDLLPIIRKVVPKAKIIFIAHEYLTVCKRNGHLVRPDGSLCSSFSSFDCVKCFPSVSEKFFTYQHYLYKKFLSEVDFVVSPSKSMHNVLNNVFELKGKLTSIGNGSFWLKDIKKFQSESISGLRQPATLAFFGQLLEDKGIYTLLKSIKDVLLVNPLVNLHLWGGNFELNSDEFKVKFNKIIAEINMQHPDRIFMHGHYKNEDILKLMSNYEVVVFPSVWPETFSLVMSEAIIAGCRVIVPNVGAFKERAASYPNQVSLYEFNSIGSLSKNIIDSMSNPNEVYRKKLDSNNLESLSIENMVNQYLNMI